MAEVLVDNPRLVETSFFRDALIFVGNSQSIVEQINNDSQFLRPFRNLEAVDGLVASWLDVVRTESGVSEFRV